MRSNSRAAPHCAGSTAEPKADLDGSNETSVRYADFVGAQRCAACHRAQYDRWSASTHGRAGGQPGAVKILGPFDGRPLHFKDAVVTPRNERGTYSFTIEEVRTLFDNAPTVSPWYYHRTTRTANAAQAWSRADQRARAIATRRYQETDQAA